MGYENRDYFRDGSYLRGAGFLDDSPTCKWLMIVTGVVFVLQILLTYRPSLEEFTTHFNQRTGVAVSDIDGNDFDGNGEFPGAAIDSNSMQDLMAGDLKRSHVQQWLQMDTAKVCQGQIWRLVTSAFCHDRMGIWHILMNMGMLYWFGRSVEATYGSKEFLLFYLAAAVLGSIGYMSLELYTGDRIPAIGASGAVMGVMCLFAMWNPGYTINWRYCIPVSITWLLVIYVAYDLHPVLLSLSGEHVGGGIAHAAHLGGLLFGFLYYRYDWQLSPTWNRIESKLSSTSRQNHRPTKKSHSHSRVPAPSTKLQQRLDVQLDEVLEKISREGQESLTERERKILNRASQRLQERKA